MVLNIQISKDETLLTKDTYISELKIYNDDTKKMFLDFRNAKVVGDFKYNTPKYGYNLDSMVSFGFLKGDINLKDGELFKIQIGDLYYD